MATPLSADRLLDALLDEGVDVSGYRSWRTHNRGQRGTGWSPVNGVMIHHTVTSGTDASVRLCYDGYAALPGPLCHGVVDKAGRVHLVGHGRANHAGAGDDDVLRAVIAERHPLPAANENNTDGNARFYGFEAINRGDGRDPWPEQQVDAIARAAAAICRAHRWTERSVIGHAEWQRGKIDPRGPGKPAAAMMRDIRARVAKLLDDSPGGAAPGTYTVRKGDTLWGIAKTHRMSVAELRRLNPKVRGDLIHPGDELRVPGARIYTVRRGDSLSGIAGRYPGVTWQEIARANRIAAPYTIHPGDELTIP
jgi:LysM repeat protein